MDTDNELIRRAADAYHRSERDRGVSEAYIATPSDASYLWEHSGRRYVVLENASGVLAVYRVLGSGILQGLKRWPPELGLE